MPLKAFITTGNCIYFISMIIYNITIKVEWAIAEDWENWMRNEHIPEILHTGCFNKYQFVRLLEIDETEGPTYAAQYFASQLSNYDDYLQHFAQNFRLKAKEKWGQRYVDFRTLMQVIE